MIITKTRATEYTQKEMKKEFNHCTTKNQLKTQEQSITKNEEQKYGAYRSQIK